MRSLRFHIAVAAILFGSVCAFGQMQPDMENGFKHWGSYDGSNIDTINMLNGNQMLHAPLIPDFGQRGALQTAVFLSQNSKLWQVNCLTNASGGIDCFWTTSAGGVVFQQAPGMSLTRTTDKNGSGTGTSTFGAFGYSITSPDGSTHQLTPVPGTADPTGEATKFDVIDTTGYHLEMSVPDSNGVLSTATVTDRHGNQYVAIFGPTGGQCGPMATNHLPSAGSVQPLIDDAPLGDQYCPQQAFAQQVTDSNGNRLTSSTNPYLGLDTLNRAMPFTTGSTTTDYSGCISSHTIANAYVLNYNAPDGIARAVKLCYANINIQTAFNVGGIFEDQNYPSPHTLQFSELVTIVLADGSKWTFDYDGYGHLISIGTPAGGLITYSWTTISFPACDANGGNVSRAVSSRTLNDNNGHSYTWTYTWGTPANGSISNTATDALGNDTVHVFTALDGAGIGECGFFETRTQYYQGTGGARQLLKQVDTAYSSAVFTVESGLGSHLGNVVPTSIQTTVYPSGKVSLVTKSYDTGPGSGRPIFGNVTTEKEYDWGQGVPGPLLRETDTTYEWQVNSAYLTAHMLDLPASVVIKDGNGTRMAETDYTYDESAYLTASGITTQHVGAPSSVRGNLTTVSKWLNTSSNPVVTHTNWYDTGEVYQTIDPLGHTTTHSYDPYYAGAYPTKTCSALSQCISGTYNFNTGVLTSFTDANAGASGQASGNTPGISAHTSNYSYDYMFRLTSAQAPPDPGNGSARAQTSFTYSAPGTLPLSIQRTRSITNTLNDVATTYFDGLGRAYRTQHTTPDGNSTVDTTYDGLDHVVQVTNPYYSTSDPTYGVIQTQYDALGRATQMTKQDGSVSSVAFDYVPIQAAPGDCTKTTDEAGKQRLTCSDGLGRLIEVHEPGDNFNGSQAQGTFSVGGSLQTHTIPGSNATGATGGVTINGSEQSVNQSTRYCAQYDENGNCVDWEIDSGWVYDAGTVTIAVNGHPDSYTFGSGDSPHSIAVGLAAAINGDGGAFVTASASNSTVSLTSKATGTAANDSLSSSYTYDSTDFSSPSFTTSNSGGALTGGTNGTSPTTVYDSGTVTVTIGSFTASASYSQSGNSTAAMVASALAGNGTTSLSRSGSPVTASASGSTITITYATVGSGGDLSVGCSSSTGQGTYFSSPSFTCPVTTAMGGGYNPEGASLDFNYFVTQYNYDALGNLLKVTQQGDPTVSSSSQWRVRNFTYDSLSRLLTATNPESGAIGYSYDANGNLLQKTSPAPNQTGTATQTISYCYDALNRVTGKAYSAQACPLSSPVVVYTYDAGANGIGHLTSLTDQAGSASYVFDPLGRITSEQRTIAGIQKSLAYTYNLDGSVATLTYPSGAVVTYTPDAAGRILSAVDTGNNISYVTGATYGPDSGLTGFVSGHSSAFSGITNSFSYNKRFQPVTMSATAPNATVFSVGYDFHLGNSDNGNVFGITNYRDQTRNQSFGYDSLNRLITAQNAGTDCTKKTVNNLTEYWGNSYGYDAWGNLLQKTVTKCSAENLSVTALANNQLVGYSYDAAGNMTHDATSGLTYSFDQENRITGAAGYTYTYDADGNRVEKSNGSAGTIYWYMSPGIVAESDLTGALKSEYVFFDGERVARKDFPGNSAFYYFSDHLKTASVITDSAGNIKEGEDYYPWSGELQFVNNDSNHYKFTGKERDAETGLDYFGARYYSNPLGRFITPDWAAKPITVPYASFGNPQSLNLYSYVKNNPTTLGDPDGHDDAIAIGATVGTFIEPGLGTAIGTGIGVVIDVGLAGYLAYKSLHHSGTEHYKNRLTAGSHAHHALRVHPGKGSPAPGTQTKADNPARPGTLGKPDHQETVRQEGQRVNGKTEVTIPTEGGIKDSRRADAVGTNPVTGQPEIVQVYRPTQAGNVPKREVDAASDIENATQVKPTMVPVRPLPEKQEPK